MKCEKWSTWCARAGGDKEAKYKETAYVITRRMVGKQPQPKWRKELDNEEGLDSEFDVKGEFECWEREDQNVTTYVGTNSEGPDWLS
eukprot:2384697-Pyramimonas_sp.AAC.1